MRNIYVLLTMSIFLMAGCGGGGGGGSSGTGAKSTSATVVLATEGNLPADKALSGISIALELPAGVTPATDSNGTVAGSVVTWSGVLANKAGILEPPTYIPPSGTTLGILKFVLYSTANEGFGIGEFATLKLNITADTGGFATVNLGSSGGTASLRASDFKVLDLSPRLLSGSEANGISIKITVEAL